MKYYSPVPIDNLKIIQEKVFEYFPKEKLSTKEALFYVPDNKNIFLSIPELKLELDKLNWTPYILAIGFYIIAPTDGSPIHVDSTSFSYSFNIPILNCEDTYVNFYRANKEPKKQIYSMYGTSMNYYKFDSAECELSDSLEMLTPHIINVREAHNIVNKNTKSRITLLIRLRNELDLSHLFQ